MKIRPAAGGGRWAEISPQRLRGWLDGFYQRHDGASEEGLRLIGASNGDVAELHPAPGMPGISDVDGFLAELAQPRKLGLLLARKGAVAAGVGLGDKILRSKVERFYVQGRTAAGGQSQQRFARRRDNQASSATRNAAGIVHRVLLPAAGELDALVCGGDRSMVDAILADPRLAPLLPLRHERLLEVPEPRYAVLVDALAAAQLVQIRLLP